MKNTVELIGLYGSDRTIALSAWTSTNRDLTPEKIARIPKLIEFLVEGSDGNSHSTPFEKSALGFMVTCDVASHIHIIKSRIGVSVNAESARYKQLSDKFLVPSDWPEVWKEKFETHAQQSFDLYHACFDSLVNEYGFTKSRAKESSRYFNTYATQLTQDIQFNFRSFVHFCNLRAAPHAQKEVREIAQEMIRQVEDYRDAEHPDQSPFHYSLRAFKLLDKLP